MALEVVVGARGPVPKRTEERLGHMTKAEKASRSRPGVSRPAVAAPVCPDDFHPVARRWYESLAESGQSVFYEPSDWATALYVGHQMSRDLHSSRLSSQAFAAVMSAMGELLTTEGSRRRVRVELARHSPAAAPVAVMNDYRDLTG